MRKEENDKDIYIVVEDYHKKDGLVFDFIDEKSYKIFLQECKLTQNNETPTMVWLKQYNIDEQIRYRIYERTYKLNKKVLRRLKIEPYKESYVIGYKIENAEESLLLKKTYNEKEK